jgi:uncharacterized phage protein (TIGR01671 family)
MREILFRGQTRRFGEKVKNFAGDPMPSNWVYGGVCCGEGAFSIIYAYMDEEKEIPIEKHVVYTDTIGQYTGLTDKNGKKIFEGDIVKAQDDVFGSPFCDGIIGKIVYDECAFFIEPINPMDSQWLYDECAVYEIIGNIHDNPELLKGE